jgi:DNA-binding transcriptional MerR regulator
MDKSPEAFRTISEVAEDMDLPQHVLRFWETRFPQIKPLKRGGGRRYYRPDDVELLRAIKELLYGEGYTIKGVQKLLREQGVPGVARSAARGSPEPAIATEAERAPPRTEKTLTGPEDLRATGEPVDAPLAPALDSRPAPAADLAALRAIQADLREAERILARARAH